MTTFKLSNGFAWDEYYDVLDSFGFQGGGSESGDREIIPDRAFPGRLEMPRFGQLIFTTDETFSTIWNLF